MKEEPKFQKRKEKQYFWFFFIFNVSVKGKLWHNSVKPAAEQTT